MKTQTRIGMALAGIVVLIVAAALIGGLSGDDDESPATGVTAATGATTGGATETAAEPTSETPAEKPDPGPLLTSGSVEKMSFSKGETVRFRARSDAGDELHVHGYDREYELPAGETVDVKFKATLDGVFEIELHNTGEQVGELRVTP